MEYFPAFVVLKGRSTLVVGGGVPAYDKTLMLADAGADVTAVAPELCKEMAMLVGKGHARHQEKSFSVEDLAGHTLVIAATGIHAVDADVSAAAQARGLPVNVVDAPTLSSFIIPTADAVARLREADPRWFWKWFFARPIASAVLGSNACKKDKQMVTALTPTQSDTAGPGAGPNSDTGKETSTAQNGKKRTATEVQPNDVPVKFFEVRMPAINAEFVAHEVSGTLMLISVEDVPCLNVAAGQTYTAQEVIRRLGP